MRRLALLPLLCALLAAVSNQTTLRLVRTSPLYAEIAHYDREIAALRATERMWSARARAARIAHDRNALEATVARATSTLSEISRRTPVYASLDSEALRAATSAQPGNDDLRYRENLALVRSDGIAQTQSDARARVVQGEAIRREQLYEREANRALALTQRDAIESMLLRVRENDLGASTAVRRAAATRLRALAQRDDAAMAAIRRQDAAVFAAYRARIADDASQQSARTVAQIRARTHADLATAAAAREGPPPAALGRAASTLRATRSAALSQANTTNAAYRAAHAALAKTFAALARRDAAAAQSVHAQIARLAQERSSFYDALAAFVTSGLASQRDERRVLRTNPPP